MKNIVRFRYPATSGTILQLALPQREYDRRPQVVGGYREAAVPTVGAARTISRIYLLDVTLRVWESEITAVESMVAWMQDNAFTAFDFWPDFEEQAGVSFPALLKAPVPGSGDLDFLRTDLGGQRDVVLTLARSTGASWGLEFFGDT